MLDLHHKLLRPKTADKKMLAAGICRAVPQACAQYCCRALHCLPVVAWELQLVKVVHM